MQNLINTTSTLTNNWVIHLDDAAALPGADNIIVPVNFWLNNKSDLKGRNIGLCIFGDTDLTAIADEIHNFDLIAIHFPAFTDGRGFSQARLIAERFAYQGEIRAIGDVLIDQLHFMKRCGINTFLLSDGIDPEKALSHLHTFSHPYQLATDIKTPLFLRR